MTPSVSLFDLTILWSNFFVEELKTAESLGLPGKVASCNIFLKVKKTAEGLNPSLSIANIINRYLSLKQLPIESKDSSKYNNGNSEDVISN